ncbi:MAG TPA: 30S ribosome-binding factor RbfA, partial [Desulfobacterales bacterium]|nr:30S ribosome-binding factor RbfA [Desulfobacterales bacterium]
MKPFTRAERVSGLIRRALSELLQKNIKDPRLEMVTITAVKMSRDLRIAKVYFSTYGGKTNKDKV